MFPSPRGNSASCIRPCQCSLIFFHILTTLFSCHSYILDLPSGITFLSWSRSCGISYSEGLLWRNSVFLCLTCLHFFHMIERYFCCVHNAGWTGIVHTDNGILFSLALIVTENHLSVRQLSFLQKRIILCPLVPYKILFVLGVLWFHYNLSKHRFIFIHSSWVLLGLLRLWVIDYYHFWKFLLSYALISPPPGSFFSF